MPIDPKPAPFVIAPAPCKPRAASTHTDRLPAPQREGSNFIRELPSIVGGMRIWPDGRKEKL
jgi:hypothetical protein